MSYTAKYIGYFVIAALATGVFSFQCYNCNEFDGRPCNNATIETCRQDENGCQSSYGTINNGTVTYFSKAAGCAKTIASHLESCGIYLCYSWRLALKESTNVTIPTCTATCCMSEKCNDPSQLPTALPPSTLPTTHGNTPKPTTGENQCSSSIIHLPTYPAFLVTAVVLAII